MKPQDSIKFGATEIGYDIVYSNKIKRARLSVSPPRKVEVTVPSDIDRISIQKIVRRKAAWVIKQMFKYDQIVGPISIKEYVNGETFLYLGRQYRLKFNKNKTNMPVCLSGKYLEVEYSETKSVTKKQVIRWYRNQAMLKIDESVKYYSKKLGIKSPQISVKNQLKRWGSCTSKNSLIFNYKIIMAPVSQLEYIVAHELCHIKEKNHTPRFWLMLKAIMPDYNKRKNELMKDGWKYSL